jgi:signal transduction histidine kinase
MDVAWLMKRFVASAVEPEHEMCEKARGMLSSIDVTIESVQRIATQLRPALLDDFGLEAAIEWQVEEWTRRTNTRCDFVSSLGEIKLSQEQSTALFRILQEALANITRHANATSVGVLLEENVGLIVLEVQDNGRGMESVDMTATKSLGMLGMQERARLVGGEVSIDSEIGVGTTVTVRLPLHDEPA